jgi:hypothetical protein
MWSEETALKILRWTVGIYVLLLFLLSFLAAEHDYIPEQLAINIFFVLSGITLLAVVQMVLASKGMNRRTLLITLGLTVAYLLIRTLNKYLG